MTEQEFTYISRVKSEIEDLTKVLYGEYEEAKNCCITKMTVTEDYEDGMEDKEYVISDDLEEEIKTLTGYADIDKLTAKMGSTKGQSITHVLIVINPTTTNDIGTGGTGAKAKTIVTQAYDKDGKKVFDEVVTQL